MKWYILAREKGANSFGVYCGYTNLIMHIFGVSDDCSFGRLDNALDILAGLQKELPEVEFKVSTTIKITNKEGV